MKNESEMLRFAESVAGKHNWSLCKDPALFSDILSGLSRNYNRYGFFLCPCRDSWGQKDKDRDIKCPCLYSQADIEKYNRCFCGLFEKKGSRKSDYFEFIPDRRPDELYPD